MEMLEVVCENLGLPTGECVPRSEVIEKQLWCRSTNVFVMNSRGEILVHQRSLAKERLPGVWSTHLGGHVGEGEDFDLNALKELQEEAGIMVSQRDLLPWRTTKLSGARLWVREYVAIIDQPVEYFVPQVGEVERFMWMTVDEIVAAEAVEPNMWCAGTHDFRTEYACLRAVAVAAQAFGALQIPDSMRIWHPVTS